MLAKEFDPSLELKYNKFYVGFSKSGQAFNFATFRPRKSTINIWIKLPKSEEIDAKIDGAGVEALEYRGAYQLSLSAEDVKKNKEFLKELMSEAYTNRSA